MKKVIRHKRTKTTNFDSYDNEVLFNVHYKKYPEFFQTYKDNPIEYTINQGTDHDGAIFRTPVLFTRDKKLKVDLFLGCSHTYGTGHHEKNIWISKVAAKTGNTPVNLGTPGRGTAKSYMNLVNYADLWDVQNIFHYQPYYPRYDTILLDYEMIDNKLMEHWTTHHINIHGPTGPGISTVFGDKEAYDKSYLETTMATEEYMKYNHNQYIYACAGFATANNINYYHRHQVPTTYSTHGLISSDWDKDINKSVISEIRGQDYVRSLTLARDGNHHTVEQQQEIGELFVEMYNTVKDRKRVGVIEPLIKHNAQLARKLTREKSTITSFTNAAFDIGGYQKWLISQRTHI